jgi:acid phosphatase type 7
MFGFTQSSACALRVVASFLPPLLLTACIGVTRAPAPTAIPPDPPGALRVSAVGDIADCRHGSPAESMAARTAALVPAGEIVLGLGDMAYQHADAATLASCYEPTWGIHRGTTIAIPGNHDYVAGDASAFIDYFRPVGAPGAGFIAHTRRLTDHWLLVALDSNVSGSALEAQYRWLEESLATERTRGDAQDCVLVMWHAPLYSSGLHRGSGDHLRRFWRLLDEYGADVVLSGHEHFYERFGPLDADGRVPPDGAAPRQFVIGTGGTQLFGFWKPPYRSESRVLEHGVLKLSLAPAGYTWQFVDVDRRVRDAGQARCRAAAN